MKPFVPSVKRNVLASWGAHGLTIIVGFFLMPYVVRVMGDDSYGTWLFINSMASYAGILYFGFGDTISRYVAKYQAEGDYRRVNQIVSLIFAIYSVMGTAAFLVAIVLSFLAPWISHWQGQELFEIQLTIAVLGLNVAVGMVGSVFGGVLMGVRRFDLERSVSVGSDLMRLVLIGVFLHERWGLLTIASIYFFITLAENLACAFFAYRCLPQLQIRRENLDRQTLKECSSFSAMAFLNAIAYQLTNATDSVVIGFVMGTDKIVPYYIALRLTQFLKQPIDKIAQICMPTAGALSAITERHRLQKFLLQAVGTVLLLVGGVFIGAWFFGGDVIRNWMGDGYTYSHQILVVLLAAQLVSLPCNVVRSFLFGMGDVRFPAILYLAEALTNLCLSIVLCSYWGLIGVAWGTFIPVLCIELGVMLPMAMKRMGITPQRLFAQAVWPQVLPLATMCSFCVVVSAQDWAHGGWLPLMMVTASGGLILVATRLGLDRLRQSGLSTATTVA
jgi:O-antigen/teichoic acid export membrane protein